jgi:hypothetical protein
MDEWKCILVLFATPRAARTAYRPPYIVVFQDLLPNLHRFFNDTTKQPTQMVNHRHPGDTVKGSKKLVIIVQYCQRHKEKLTQGTQRRPFRHLQSRKFLLSQNQIHRRRYRKVATTTIAKKAGTRSCFRWVKQQASYV